MAEDAKAGTADRNRIDVDRDNELHGWAADLGVSPADPCRAVAEVGPVADDVRRHLRR